MNENVNEKKEQSVGEILKEKLFLNQKSAFEVMNNETLDFADSFCEGYKDFLNKAKTEREAVKYFEEKAKEQGFEPFEYGKKYVAGDKVYYNNRGKAIYLVVFGKESLDKGVSIAAAHIDSPRIDLKQNPLYENSGMAFFKTHYYGGIKKYQWTTIPLAMHGTVCKKDGTGVDVCIGEDENDPVFCITDLLPHLATDQMGKTLYKAFSGEDLNVLAGSRPFDDEKINERIKLNILKYLNEKYDITEEDFLSAELTFVPAEKARDLGLDRSMILSYGHDDRVCAYPIAIAAFEAARNIPDKTAVVILADKEETGSDGNTGMKSASFENMLTEFAINANVNPRKMFENSKCLSADVNACFDPNFGEVYEVRNSCHLNKGVCVTKFTGARGKSSTNDAHAEYMAYIRQVLDAAGVLWQTGELGKVDQGGGGTVAMYISKLNIDTVDIGVPVLSMHAPYEVVSKTDVYSAYKAFKAFIHR